MTALLIENDGSVAAATAQFSANIDPKRASSTRPSSIRCWRRTDISGDADDPLFNFSVATPINNQEGNIHGFELPGAVLPRQYRLRRFGLLHQGLRRRRVSTSAPTRPTTCSRWSGLSDSFNVTVIYEKNGLSARLAYNWRDKFLAATNRGGSRNPVFYRAVRDARSATSATTSRANIAVSLEAINLTERADPDLWPRRRAICGSRRSCNRASSWAPAIRF